MGIGKWWLTHGIGSPGAVAKRIVKNYVLSKKENPDLAEEELFHIVLAQRMCARALFRQKVLSDEEMASVAAQLNGSLYHLVLFVLHFEDERINQCKHETPAVYSLILEIVGESIEKYS